VKGERRGTVEEEVEVEEQRRGEVQPFLFSPNL
jgi:hypothetical protein